MLYGCVCPKNPQNIGVNSLSIQMKSRCVAAPGLHQGVVPQKRSTNFHGKTHELSTGLQVRQLSQITGG